MAEEASGCQVPHRPWVSIWWVALLLLLLGMVIGCLVCSVHLTRKQQLDSTGVSPEGRKRETDVHLPSASSGAWGPPAGAGPWGGGAAPRAGEQLWKESARGRGMVS